MSVIRVRTSPGGKDAYGEPVESTVTRKEIPGAVLAPVDTTDVDATGRDGTIERLDLLIHDPDWDLHRTDQIEVDGDQYRIAGVIQRYRNPHHHGADGLVARLERGVG